MIFTRYTTLILFILFFVTYIENLRFKNLLCGDIETNPAPFNRCKSISCYHWNLNGLLNRNREKFHLDETFVFSNKTDIFCISETFLDSSVDNIYDGLNINCYTLVRSYHPSNTKSGGVAVYYKDHHSFGNIRLENNKCFLTSLYRSVSQSKDQFDEFCSSLNMLMLNFNNEKPLASIITEDFNARSKNCWSQDITLLHLHLVITN